MQDQGWAPPEVFSMLLLHKLNKNIYMAPMCTTLSNVNKTLVKEPQLTGSVLTAGSLTKYSREGCFKAITPALPSLECLPL